MSAPAVLVPGVSLHWFSLTYRLQTPRDWAFDWVDALGRHCPDAAVRAPAVGMMVLVFSREATSWDAAVASAKASVSLAVPGAELVSGPHPVEVGAGA
jgi:hypothetical protein